MLTATTIGLKLGMGKNNDPVGYAPHTTSLVPFIIRKSINQPPESVDCKDGNVFMRRLSARNMGATGNLKPVLSEADNLIKMRTSWS